MGLSPIPELLHLIQAIEPTETLSSTMFSQTPLDLTLTRPLPWLPVLTGPTYFSFCKILAKSFFFPQVILERILHSGIWDQKSSSPTLVLVLPSPRILLPLMSPTSNFPFQSNISLNSPQTCSLIINPDLFLLHARLSMISLPSCYNLNSFSSLE